MPAPLIAHVLFRFDVGGLENGVVNLINRMPPDRFRHVIVALSDYTDFRQRLQHDVPVYALHKREGKDFGLHLRLYRLFRRLRPDVVHTRNLNAVEAQLPAWLAGVPGRVHGEHGWDVHDLDGSSRKYRLWRKLFRPFVQRYIPLSQHLSGYLAQEIGVSAERIACICNGVDTDKFHPAFNGREPLPEEAFARDRAAAAQTRIVIGTVGRMEQVKDQMTLAKAFAELVARRPDIRESVRLVMVGDGRLRQDVLRFLRESGLEEMAWLPGSRNDTAELLRAFDVFVLPSLAEGISNTILEAMASGLPVVATDVGGNGELVQAGETGYLVPRNDPDAMARALERYVDDQALRRAHGDSGRRRTEQRFSLDGMVDRYVQVYESLLRFPVRQTAAEADPRR